MNSVAAQAEKDLQAYRVALSEFVLATTDEMIAHATNSLAEGGDDPKAPMIGACTLYPTNYLNHYTKELNGKVAEIQGKVNGMKFAVLNSLMNKPMISEAEATFANVQREIGELPSWTQMKSELEADISVYKAKVAQLVVDMKECIEIAEG